MTKDDKKVELSALQIRNATLLHALHAAVEEALRSTSERPEHSMAYCDMNPNDKGLLHIIVSHWQDVDKPPYSKIVCDEDILRESQAAKLLQKYGIEYTISPATHYMSPSTSFIPDDGKTIDIDVAQPGIEKKIEALQTDYKDKILERWAHEPSPLSKSGLSESEKLAFDFHRRPDGTALDTDSTVAALQERYAVLDKTSELLGVNVRGSHATRIAGENRSGFARGLVDDQG